MDDQQIDQLKLNTLPFSPAQLVRETLSKVGRLRPADLVLYGKRNQHYCQPGRVIELGLEGFLRSQFTMEKASEVTTAISNDVSKHEKLCQHVVDELMH